MELDIIYNEDCIEGMKKIPDSSIDLIVTDPPYLMKYKTNYRKDNLHKFCSEIAGDDDLELIINYIKECYRIMKNDSACYMFCNSNKVDVFKREIEKVGFNIKNIIVWVKNNWSAGDLKAAYGKQYEFILYVNKGRRLINGSRLTDVWAFNKVSGKKTITPKPKTGRAYKTMYQKKF